jgi:hypothetical protein
MRRRSPELEAVCATAVHEAGHAACAQLLNATRHSGPVTIVPTAGYTGICFTGRPRRYPQQDLDHLARPYPLVPARLRRYFECEVMIYYAGAVAESLHLVRGEPVPATEPGPDLAAALPPREAALLEQAAASDDDGSDVAKAGKILAALHFGDEDLAARHARFLAAETEALLAGRRARAMVAALADALLTHRTLPARRWKAVLAQA